MNLNLPLSLYYETCDEDGMVEPYFTGDITDSEGRVICRADSEAKALDLIGGFDDLLANIGALRAQLAEVEAQRGEAKRSIRLAIGMMQQGNFDAEDVAYVLEKSLAKLEANDGK